MKIQTAVNSFQANLNARYVVAMGGSSDAVSKCQAIVSKAEESFQTGLQQALASANRTDLSGYARDEPL